MRSLRASVIRLAYENPSLRPHLLPLVKEADATIEAGRLGTEISRTSRSG
jgi:hypothetical protein